MTNMNWRTHQGEYQVYDQIRNVGRNKKIYCPVCQDSFKGINADKDYKEHYKKSHGARTNNIRRKEL